jgi:hypothetical protein
MFRLKLKPIISPIKLHAEKIATKMSCNQAGFETWNHSTTRMKPKCWRSDMSRLKSHAQKQTRGSISGFIIVIKFVLHRPICNISTVSLHTIHYSYDPWGWLLSRNMSLHEHLLNSIPSHYAAGVHASNMLQNSIYNMHVLTQCGARYN